MRVCGVWCVARARVYECSVVSRLTIRRVTVNSLERMLRCSTSDLEEPDCKMQSSLGFDSADADGTTDQRKKKKRKHKHHKHKKEKMLEREDERLERQERYGFSARALAHARARSISCRRLSSR